MPVTEQPTISVDTPPRRPSLLRRAAVGILRWTYRLVGTVVILCALLVGVAQTSWFREQARIVVLDQLNAALEGAVTVDDVRLDIFRGLMLDHPVLYAHGTTVLEAASLNLTYDLALLSKRVVAVNEVRLVRPVITVLRDPRDSVWNVARIVRPSTDTTTTPPPDLHIAVRRFEIVDGSILVNDRTAAWSDGTSFDPLHLQLADVQLQASLRLDLAGEDYAVNIDRFSFHDLASPLDVRSLQLAARLTHGGVQIPLLRLRTAESDVAVTASAPGLDVLTGMDAEALGRHPLRATLDAERFWAPDLHYFLPDIDILDAYKTRCNVVYDGRSVVAENLVLDAERTHIEGRVRVDNLDGAAPLALDVHLYRSHATFADVRRRLRFVPLPDLPFLGTTVIDSLHMKGAPEDSLWFDVRGGDRPGRIDGTMTLVFGGKDLRYHVDMDIADGQVGVFLDDSSTFRTNLNGHVRGHGTGFVLPGLRTDMAVDLGPSTVADRRLRSLALAVRADGSGRIDIDSLVTDLTKYGQDSLGAVVDVGRRQTFAVRGAVDVVDLDHPVYDVVVRTEGLDVATLVGNAGLPSVLSTSLAITGSGVHPDSMQTSVTGYVNELYMAERTMLPFHLAAFLGDTAGEHVLDVRAAATAESDPFFRVRVAGRYGLTAMASSLGSGLPLTIDVVRRQLRHVTGQAVVPSPLPEPLADVEATVELDANDLSLLRMVMGDVEVDGSARMRARVRTTASTLEVVVDTLVSGPLRLEVGRTVVDAMPMTVSAAIRTVDLQGVPSMASVHLAGAVDSTVHLGSTTIRRPRFALDLVDGVGPVAVALDVDGIVASVGGRITMADTGIVMRVDSLSATVDTSRAMVWRTAGTGTVAASDGRYRIAGLSFQRQWGELITITGAFTTETFMGLRIGIDNFPLRDIRRFGRLQPTDPVALVDGLVTKATVVLNGPWATPVIDADLTATDVSYNGEHIGTQTMKLRHENRTITGEVRIVNPRLTQAEDALRLDVVSLPFDCALADVPERLVSGRPIDLRLVASRLSLAAAEPFLPAIEKVRGLADGQVAVSGIIGQDVNFSGKARFRRTTFLTSSTNIVYEADGALRLEGSELIFDTLVVRNESRDMPGGIAYAEGRVTFDGFAVSAIDFTLRSPGVHVMSPASQARSPMVYGDLRIRTGFGSLQPLRLHGPLDAPRLDGDIMITYGDITFPKERSSTKRRLGSFTYVGDHDTVVPTMGSVRDYVTEPLRMRSAPPPVVVDSSARTDTTPTETDMVADAIGRTVKAQAGGFADLLSYNLNVYFGGRFVLTMVLGPTELLIADLELDDPRRPLRVGGVLANLDLQGRVRVRPGTSTYQFFRSFAASGILDFSQGGLTNPRLDLLAVYEDSRYVGERREDFRVEIIITGTKLRPVTDFRVYRNDQQMVGDSTKIRGDALMLILLGRTQEELTASGQGNLVGEVNSVASAAATQLFADLLGGVGNVKAQVDLGANLNESRLTLSGQILGGVSYRVTGNVSDISGNSDFTVTIPLSVLGDAEAFRYFVLDLSQTINQTGNVTRQQRDWQIKLGVRLP